MTAMRDILEFKRAQLEEQALLRDEYRRHPPLTWLFFEVTRRCNLRCRHCGSACTGEGESLQPDDIRMVLNSLPDRKPLICLTGGEPLMHPAFEEIAETVSGLGFHWGMTTNATLIGPKQAQMLRRTRLSTVSVSLDGLPESHDRLRCAKGAWDKAVAGIRHLQEAGFDPQVSTVVHPGNLQDLDPLYRVLLKMGITSWRIINVEPIGRACEEDDLLLDEDAFRKLIAYIREKRFDPSCPMEVTFGCSHYLGVAHERMVRDSYFMCGAGLFVASVRANGDICACLDIENRPELVQGNIHRDGFMDVWLNRFSVFREDRTGKSAACSVCPDRQICGGDSAHTWDYERSEPLLCAKKILDTP